MGSGGRDLFYVFVAYPHPPGRRGGKHKRPGSGTLASRNFVQNNITYAAILPLYNKVKMKFCVIKHHTLKTYGRVEV
jgi:hypothetical protein